ncbi:MAG: hypothetical protein G01um101438_265 [Parcubacteria group bacterium Gr01-1014_38]|nr:MAG: hypothetical protein G01um101438_265 [Parcubacteria group bacterium Gr01-1014_38]
MQYSQAVLDVAKEFVFSSLGTSFTADETRALRPFFTNLDRRVFFMHTLPPNIGATLLAMFSRMKNPRGLRGVWVESFLPQFLATRLSTVEREFGGDEVAFLRAQNISNLGSFLASSEEARQEFDHFLECCGADPQYLREFAESKKTRKFLTTWLDKYGHNSIARMASFWLCFEGVSLLAAKSIEWTRPGSGYIELSTRYVDMSTKGRYPIERELAAGWSVNPETVVSFADVLFRLYQELVGRNFTGPFPTFLRERYGGLYHNTPKDLETGVIGETCDILGNLLPASTLTSVGVCVSGEAFPMLLKHLLLDETPENLTLVELVLEEAAKIGAHQFARHFEPTAWDRAHWRYLSTRGWFDTGASGEKGRVRIEHIGPFWRDSVEHTLLPLFPKESRPSPPFAYLMAHEPFTTARDPYDKLPAEFEAVSFPFRGLMSFRGWRDLQRQGFCTHFRTYLTPDLGFYQYDKPAPPELPTAFAEVHRSNRELDMLLQGHDVPAMLRQYSLALGNIVGFHIVANLRQWEFCTWQRTGWNVNHEVRKVFLAIEEGLRDLIPWWRRVSRANTTPAYVFARGDGAIPLPIE